MRVSNPGLLFNCQYLHQTDFKRERETFVRGSTKQPFEMSTVVGNGMLIKKRRDRRCDRRRVELVGSGLDPVYQPPYLARRGPPPGGPGLPPGGLAPPIHQTEACPGIQMDLLSEGLNHSEHSSRCTLIYNGIYKGRYNESSLPSTDLYDQFIKVIDDEYTY